MGGRDLLLGKSNGNVLPSLATPVLNWDIGAFCSLRVILSPHSGLVSATDFKLRAGFHQSR
jgi:hypothetical protein